MFITLAVACPPLRVVPQSAASLVARCACAPSSGSPSSLLLQPSAYGSAPAEVVGGKGHRYRGLAPPDFLSAGAGCANGGLAGAPPSAVAYSPRLLRLLLTSHPRPPFLQPARATFCAISKIRYNRYRSILYRTTYAIVFILKMANARSERKLLWGLPAPTPPGVLFMVAGLRRVSPPKYAKIGAALRASA